MVLNLISLTDPVLLGLACSNAYIKQINILIVPHVYKIADYSFKPKKMIQGKKYTVN